MKTIEDLMSEWSKDSVMDPTEPGNELLRIPQLHAKYLNFLVTNTAVSKNASFDIAKRKKVLFDYFQGLMEPDELEANGFSEPWRHLKNLKDNPHHDADDTLNNLMLKKANADAIIDYCDRVLKELNSRTFQLRSYIDW